MKIRIEAIENTCSIKDLEHLDIVEWTNNNHANSSPEYREAVKRILVIKNGHVDLYSLTLPRFVWTSMDTFLDFKFRKIGRLTVKE